MNSEVALKIQNGEPLSDAELRDAQTFYHKLIEDLEILGPEFRLATKELHRVDTMLKSFMFQRGMLRS